MAEQNPPVQDSPPFPTGPAAPSRVATAEAGRHRRSTSPLRRGGPFGRLAAALFGYDFFISYWHRTAGIWAEALHDELESGSPAFSAFLDRDPLGFVAGQPLADETERALAGSTAVLVLAARRRSDSSGGPAGRRLSAYAAGLREGCADARHAAGRITVEETAGAERPSWEA